MWKFQWITRLFSLENMLGTHGVISTRIIKEGSAEIKIPEKEKVFYNPVQEFNRDLSVSVLTVAAKQHSGGDTQKCFRILEALSATGLRSIRYAKEIPYVTEVLANDISKSAVEIIANNIKHNAIGDKVKISNFDAVEVMFNNRHPRKRFQVVDLDPYGSPSPFLDTAVQCVEDGGLLLVTCTDMAVLCGNSPEACLVKYGATSLKTKACHEMALRIALHCIQSNAAKYKRYIEPLLSISVDFYIRLFVRIHTSAYKCKEIASKLSMVYQCNGCDAIHLQQLGVIKRKNDSQKNLVYNLPIAPVIDRTCVYCNGRHHMAGPIWSAPLHDLNFVREVLNVAEESTLSSKGRILGLLNMILEELNDVPLYYALPKLLSNVKGEAMPMMVFRSAILNGGYRISYSHTSRDSFKTDAPVTFIWDVIREWIKMNPSKKKPENGPGYHLLNKTSENKIDFSLRPDANPLSRKNRLLRFPENPAPFWGPGTRSTLNNEKEEKSIRNQNKKKRRAAEILDEGEAKKIVSNDVVLS